MPDSPFIPLAQQREAVWHDDLQPRMSATQITMLARCPEQYRQRYVLGIKAPPGPALIWGRADDKAIGAHFQKVVDVGDGLTPDEVAERFVVEYDQAIDEEGGVSSIQWKKEGPTPDGGARRMAAADKDAGVKLALAYHKQVAPLVEPLSVQQEIEIIDPSWAVPVIGYLDVETEGWIIERKTSKNKVSTPKGDWVIQGRIYQLGVPKSLFWHLSVKSKEPWVAGNDSALMEPVVEYRRNITRKLVANAQGRLADLYGRLGPDEPWDDAVTHPWACGFCGYRNDCPWWA